ncbi:uncharacterized protein LOC110701552 [Chenopodium quinoa]|uniref:uncharacterized protein LOC110701552 n=1 Tax=Chenopodium quinoa TaxID=63459 RepID=UPI000B770A9F|nr:uncharacterized protein LOC110701552 [Chenopodium quinoa]
MLVSAEKQIPKKPKKEVLIIHKGKGFKNKGKKAYAKSKGKQVAKAPEKPKASPKPKAASESECFYCKKKGHWKRNCQKYLDFLKKNRASTSVALLNIINVVQELQVSEASMEMELEGALEVFVWPEIAS